MGLNDDAELGTIPLLYPLSLTVMGGQKRKRTSEISNVTTNSVARKAILARRISQSERNQAMANDPLGPDGKSFCWGSNSKLGRFRGQSCPNAHAVFKNENRHWSTQSELARRGGRRHDEQNIPLGKSDRLVEQLRSENQRKLGGQIGESKWPGRISAQNEFAPSSTPPKNKHPPDLSPPAPSNSIPGYESAIRDKHSIPQAPNSIGSFDVTALGNRARKLRYSDDHWVTNNRNNKTKESLDSSTVV